MDHHLMLGENDKYLLLLILIIKSTDLDRNFEMNLRLDNSNEKEIQALHSSKISKVIQRLKIMFRQPQLEAQNKMNITLVLLLVQLH